MKIITAIKSENCLKALMAHLTKLGLDQELYIETGYDDKLCIEESIWLLLSKDTQEYIETVVYNFIMGWEAKEEW